MDTDQNKLHLLKATTSQTTSIYKVQKVKYGNSKPHIKQQDCFKQEAINRFAKQIKEVFREQ